MSVLDNRQSELSSGERLEWAYLEEPPETFSARRLGGVWVVSKMGVYADTEALLTKIVETVSYYESLGVLASVRLSVETIDEFVARRYT
ncbi:MAG: hypothetical protein WAM92_17855 [Mycobacterium sp.]